MSIENYNSILFYIALALIISFFFSSIFKSDSKNRVLIFEYRKIKFCNIIYITLFLILLFFASYRTVKFSHGGSDAWYYVNYFLYGSKVEFSLKNILTFSGKICS